MRFPSLLSLPVFLCCFSVQAQNTFPANGNVGIGTTSPGYPLSVGGTTYGWDSAIAYFTNNSTSSNNAFIAATPGMTPGNETYFSFGVDTHANDWASYGFYYAGPGSASNRIDIGFPSHNQLLTVLASGNVGVGTATPGEMLDVNGNVKVSGSGAAVIFPDGTRQSTAYTGGNTGGGGAASLPDITDAGGKVGIGTSTPSAKLEVNGGIKLSSGSGGVLTFADGTTQSTAGVTSSGNVNLGTPNKPTSLFVWGAPLGTTAGSVTNLLSLLNYNQNQNMLNISQIRNSGASSWESTTTRIQEVTDVTSQGYIDFNPANGSYALAMGSGSTEWMRLTNGNVGIGTTTPGAKLEVNGNLKLTGGSGASMTFPDNSVQSTAWNGTIGGQDYADTVDVAGDRSQYEPGDVLMIDSDSDRTFRKVAEPYSRLVAGVFSTKPGLVGHLTPSATAAHGVPLAMAGIVPAKVSTENGPIHRGDLLVASSTPGYAMKGTDPALLTGAVIGKALGTLPSGKGVIEVLIALQ